MLRMVRVSLMVLLVAFGGCGKSLRNQTYTGVLEGKSVHVPALTGGKIIRIYVETGQQVTKGDTIAIIDTTELVLLRRQSRAALEELKAQVRVANTNLQTVKADMDYVFEKRERARILFEQQAIPKQDLDDLSNQAQRAQSVYDDTREQVRAVEARKEQAEAQVSTVEKKISDAAIMAPISGFVATRYFEIGEAVPPMQPVVELIDLSELDVKIYIAEEMLSQVKYDQEVKIRVDGVKEEMKGRIIWISAKAEFTPKNIMTPQTRTSLVYAVKVAVPNPKLILKHGMPVEVIL
jgi:HlyD family secretion protein